MSDVHWEANQMGGQESGKIVLLSLGKGAIVPDHSVGRTSSLGTQLLITELHGEAISQGGYHRSHHHNEREVKKFKGHTDTKES